jgi:hypothetical protein
MQNFDVSDQKILTGYDFDPFSSQQLHFGFGSLHLFSAINFCTFRVFSMLLIDHPVLPPSAPPPPDSHVYATRFRGRRERDRQSVRNITVIVGGKSGIIAGSVD